MVEAYAVPVALFFGIALGCLSGLFFKVRREVPNWHEMGWRRGFYVRVIDQESE